MFWVSIYHYYQYHDKQYHVILKHMVWKERFTISDYYIYSYYSEIEENNIERKKIEQQKWETDRQVFGQGQTSKTETETKTKIVQDTLAEFCDFIKLEARTGGRKKFGYIAQPSRLVEPIKPRWFLYIVGFITQPSMIGWTNPTKMVPVHSWMRQTTLHDRLNQSNQEGSVHSWIY